MKKYLIEDEWKIIENQFHPDHNLVSESNFSTGNGRMGQRGNFEEDFSGQTLQGSYVAGVYYPDKTRVGWWKNGYPEYFAKVLNATNWIGLKITVNGENLDLNTWKVNNFYRELDMRNGVLTRKFSATSLKGDTISVHTHRFLSIVDDDTCALQYNITADNFSGTIEVISYLDADIKNQDSNYGEKFWNPINEIIVDDTAFVTAETKKTEYRVCAGMKNILQVNGKKVSAQPKALNKEKYAEFKYSYTAKEGDTLSLTKYSVVLSSLNEEKSTIEEVTSNRLNTVSNKGFETLLDEQNTAWAKKWEEGDIIIKGDVSAQQAIRFNIFQLYATYTGEDERLNIGPKGFTGEKYGGSTYWDTEAYCLPFYLATSEQKVSKNLVYYRYKHLEKAIENAEKLGFTNGAALYPMVTMNGEECHNEWEITFEEIHRNGAMVKAIYDYVNYYSDIEYLHTYGIEVMVGIARFWAQRVNWSNEKQKYVMLGVTGPNEFENNINNNWYTNKLAAWCLDYTLEVLASMKANAPEKLDALVAKTKLNLTEETKHWKHVSDEMFYPYSEEHKVFLQQDGFLDKDLTPVKDLPSVNLPLVKKWSWDRILRSAYIKQADTLQGFYWFEDEYDLETIKRHYDFYEPLTVHESSLSPCVHAILASKIGDHDRAYQFYLRTARLDLDNYNHDTEDGLHITSMAGTWLAVTHGFGGLRMKNGVFHFEPFLPKEWESCAFNLVYRGQKFSITIKQTEIVVKNNSDKELPLVVEGKEYNIKPGNEEHIPH
ncbi:MAG: family 65 glycosyl hydrolase domain-containing protein [Luteibaculaceae bacterium]